MEKTRPTDDKDFQKAERTPTSAERTDTHSQPQPLDAEVLKQIGGGGGGESIQAPRGNW